MLKFIPQNAQIKKGQKVYLCAETSDIKKYEELLINDIRSVVPEAVLFSQDIDNPEYKYDFEEVKKDLYEMQLFVIPVTNLFLSTDNNARLKELKYARKESIPVLPILLEENLESKFNELCGNLQCLNRVSIDKYAITYERKLSDYLNLALVGNTLSEQIKKAFDAYIFLSYRKKDRAAAQEIMRLIHENDFCRSFAIWYDEFLVPGEAFDTSIQSALHKSKLFAMVMSSNMIKPLENGDPNYIMEYEYPAAKEKKERDNNEAFILPIAVEEVSQTVSNRFFPGIPDSIDKNKKQELTSALEEALSKHIKIHSDDESRHLYYMGMAYLNGVDVEINRKLGIELLKKAADGGDEYAACELGSLFSQSWNYEESVKYYERYVEILRPTKKYKSILWYGYNNLIYYLMEENQLVLAEKYSKEAISCAKKYALIDSNEADSILSSLYDMAGRICKDLGKNQKALSYYISALEIDEKSFEKTNEFFYARNLCISYNSIAKLYKTLKQPHNSKQYIFKALSIIEKELIKNPDNYDVIDEASKIFLEIPFHNAFDDWDKSLEYALKALDLYKKRIALRDNRENRFAVQYPYAMLVGVYIVLEQYENALETANNRIEVLENIAPEGRNNNFYSSLIDAYKQKAECLKLLERHDDELEPLREIHKISKNHLHIPNDPTLSDQLSWCYKELAQLLIAKGPEYLKESNYYYIAFYREKFKKNCNKVLYLMDEGIFDEAENLCEIGIKDCEYLSGFTKKSEDYLKLTYMYFRKAELFDRRHDEKQNKSIAEECYKKVLAIGETHSLNDEKYNVLFVQSQQKLIKYYMEAGKYQLASTVADVLYQYHKNNYINSSTEANLEKLKKVYYSLCVAVAFIPKEKNLSIRKRIILFMKSNRKIHDLVAEFASITGLLMKIKNGTIHYTFEELNK